MQGLWLENCQIQFRKDLPRPTAHKGEALVRVRLAGICATDLEMMKGYYPFTGIPGHEFAGEVAAVGAGTAAPDHLQIGQRVVGEINVTCGACRACRGGYETHCERRKVLGIKGLNGAFAQYLVLPLENLHPIPEGVSDEQAVFTEPLAAALEIQEQVAIRPADRVLVVGGGRLGQLIAQTLVLTGCELSVVARHDAQRSLLREWKVATIDENETGERAYDVVVEASGSPGGFELARRAVRPRGKIVLKSTYAGKIEANLSALVVDEITLVGSRCGPFPPALRLLERGEIDPLPLISARYPLEQGVAACEHALQPGAMKILLSPDLPPAPEA